MKDGSRLSPAPTERDQSVAPDAATELAERVAALVVAERRRPTRGRRIAFAYVVVLVLVDLANLVAALLH